jgi:hypothetical protein
MENVIKVQEAIDVIDRAIAARSSYRLIWLGFGLKRMHNGLRSVDQPVSRTHCPAHTSFQHRLERGRWRSLRAPLLGRYDNQYATKFIDPPREVQSVFFQHVHRVTPMTFIF